MEYARHLLAFAQAVEETVAFALAVGQHGLHQVPPFRLAEAGPAGDLVAGAQAASAQAVAVDPACADAGTRWRGGIDADRR